jgi:hypothetical protein
VIKIEHVQVGIAYGLCPEGLAGETLIPTSWQGAVNDQNACAVIASFRLLRQGYRVPLPSRPERPGYPGQKDMFVRSGGYMLPDAIWDHEKVHIPQVKRDLDLAILELEKWMLDPQNCLSKENACKIVNGDQEYLRLRIDLIENRLRNLYSRQVGEHYASDEAAAQREEAKKYDIVMAELEGRFSCP